MTGIAVGARQCKALHTVTWLFLNQFKGSVTLKLSGNKMIKKLRAASPGITHVSYLTVFGRNPIEIHAYIPFGERCLGMIFLFWETPRHFISGGLGWREKIKGKLPNSKPMALGNL